MAFRRYGRLKKSYTWLHEADEDMVFMNDYPELSYQLFSKYDALLCCEGNMIIFFNEEKFVECCLFHGDKIDFLSYDEGVKAYFESLNITAEKIAAYCRAPRPSPRDPVVDNLFETQLKKAVR